MGNQNISVELASLEQAVGSMTSQVVDEITSLRKDWGSYLGQISRNDWSSEDACLAFGSSYVSAIEAYDAVMEGMKTDITRYRDELDATVQFYRNSDDRSMKEMNTRLSKLDDAPSAADEAGRGAYGQRPNLDDGTDTPAPAPGDTSPEA